MSLPDQLVRTLQAFPVLHEEPGIPTTVPALSLPGLQQVLESLGPLPPQALFLGMADDGLPILMDLDDPQPAPLAVIGECGSGKTAFLQMLASLTHLSWDPGDVQFGVITDSPEEWSSQESLPGSLGVWPAHHPASREFLRRWADPDWQIKQRRQDTLLLLDGLEFITNASPETQRDLRGLLMNGPSRRTWLFATADISQVPQLSGWLELFHTRICGQIHRQARSCALSTGNDLCLNPDLAGIHFILEQPSSGLHFWIPSVPSKEEFAG